ncbi:MAG: P-II family nitrogen regulator [Clostridia bacterium]|nr:P-II family nitrogen regulator [Clostridia bacterium]
MKKFEHEVIFCIVNAGFSDAVMDAARELGARGGTVIRARGTANSESEKLFGITIQPEKEMVMILVKSSIKDDILHALYRAVGLNTPGQGIAFSLPVDQVVGLSEAPAEPKEEKEPKAAE